MKILNLLLILFLSPLSFFAGNFGIVSETIGRTIALDPQKNARVLQPNTLLKDKEEIFTDPGSRLLLITLDGNKIYVFENTHLKLTEVREVNEKREFETKIVLDQGSIVAYFGEKNYLTILTHANHQLNLQKTAFLFFSSFKKNSIDLFSPNQKLKLQEKNLPYPLFLDSGIMVKNYDGKTLTLKDYETKPEIGLSLFLDRKNLFFKKDDIRTLLITIQLIRLSTKQNYSYSLPLRFFSNIDLNQNMSSIRLNSRGYAYLELNIPEIGETRFQPENFEIYIFADLPESYSIFPGYVKLPFLPPEDSTQDN